MAGSWTVLVPADACQSHDPSAVAAEERRILGLGIDAVLKAGVLVLDGQGRLKRPD